MRFRIKLILLIFLLTFTKLTAFKPAVELEKQLDTAKGIYRVDILNELAELNQVNSISKSIKFASLAFQDGLRINYELGWNRAAAMMLSSSSLLQPTRVSSDLCTFVKYLEQRTDNPAIVNFLSIGLAKHYAYNNEFDIASKYFLKALKIAETHPSNEQLAFNYRWIGWFYTYILDYENSADNYIKSINLYLTDGDTVKYFDAVVHGIDALQSARMNNLADSYLVQFKYVLDKNADSVYLAAYYKFQGLKALNNKEYNKAEYYLLKASEIFKSKSSMQFLGDTYTMLAHIYSQKKDYQKSLLYNSYALKVREDFGAFRYVLSSQINIGIDYLNIGENNTAINMFRNCAEKAYRLNTYHYYTRATNWLFQAFSKIHQLDSAHHYFQLYTIYYEKIKLDELRLSTIKFQLKSELEKKDRDLVEMALDKEKNKNFYILIIVALIIIIAIVLYIRFRQKHKINLILTDKNIMLEEANKNISAKENALSELNSELDNLVKERTKHLDAEIKQRIMAEENIIQLKDNIQSAYEKEKELNIMKTRFMSMISHEFRTPLTVIVSSSDIMKLESENDNPEKIQKQSLKIRNSVKQMTSLIDDVIAFNNTESSTYILRIDEIEICNLIQEIISEQKLTYKSSVIVDFDSNVNPLNMYSDKRILRHILSNLIGNAVKYTPFDKNISVNIIKKQNIIYIQISDQGIGIPPTDMENIWEPFFRGSNIRNISGTGFGLYIVKDFVTKLGGEINITSKINEGTTVSLIVPVKSN